MKSPDGYDFTAIPFDRVVRLGQKTLLYTDLFNVSWLLGRFCNYRCSYCWPHGRSDEKDHRPTEVLIKTMDEIKRQARERGFNSFHFSFSGGEPTLHPGYLEIIEHYGKDRDHTGFQSVHMTSNCSPGLKWFERYSHATRNLDFVSVTASFHKEFAKREALVEKLIFLQTQDVHVTVNMVMVPARFNELWDDALFFRERGVNVTLKPQSNETASQVVDGYTPEQLALLRTGLPQRNFTAQRAIQVEGRPQRRPYPIQIMSSGDVDASGAEPIMQVELMDEKSVRWDFDQAERLNAFKFNRFEGWECSAGYRSIVIREPGGSIKRSYSCRDEPLGSIEKGFKLFEKPRACVTPSCVSSADSKIPKRKGGVRLPLWPGDMTFEKEEK